MSFYEFPHTRTYDSDLGWLIRRVIEIKKELREFINLNTIKYADPIAWNITTQYETNTVVINPADGTAYISTQPVPSGVLITNPDYWTPIFNYGESMQTMREQLVPLDEGSSPTATQYIYNGTLFWWNGLLYRALYDFPAGTAFIEDTNVERIDLLDWINERVNRVILDTCAEMRSCNLLEGEEVITLGYHAINDGGAALYKVESSPRGFSEALENGLYAILCDEGDLNSKQVGMWGDNIHDDTAAFNAVLAYMENDNVKTLHMKDGLYRISGAHTIPYGTCIIGDGNPRIPTWQNNDWNFTDRTGAVFAITGGEGTTTTDYSPFRMLSYSSLINLGFWYPDQPVQNVESPVLYPPTIALIPDPGEYDSRNNNVVLDNITFGNAYLGISAECLHTCFTLKRSFLYAFKNALTIDQSVDIDRISNIHMNMMGILFDQGFPAGSPRYWQFNSGESNYGVIVRKADAAIFEDVFIYGFHTPFYVDGTISGHRPNGITFRNCASEGCVQCFRAQGGFTRVKLMFCSFGVNATKGDVAVYADGTNPNNPNAPGQELYIANCTVWRSNDRCMEIRNTDDVMITNTALLQMTVTGLQRASALMMVACRRCVVSNLETQIYRNADYSNTTYVYTINSKGIMYNQIIGTGLAGQASAVFNVDGGNHGVTMRGLMCGHPATAFVSGSAVNCSAETPIDYSA